MATSITKFRFVLNPSRIINSFQCYGANQSLRRLSSLQICFNDFGDPNKALNKRVTELSSPLSDNDVLVKMLMAPINPSDVNTIEGTYFIKPKLPAVAGNEGVGKIAEIGSNVRGLSVGDLVIPSKVASGTWQTYQITNQEHVIKLPNDISILSAATIYVNPTSAYRMLKDFADLSPGDVIIQNGANSGVGVSVIQLAKEWNITTINIVRDRPDLDGLRNYLKSLGADYVITEDFVRSPEMRELVKSFPAKPKLALNCVGGTSASELIRLVDQGGAVVTYGGMSKRPVTVPTGALIFKEVKLFGYWNTKWHSDEKNSIPRLEMLSELCDMIKRNKFVPPPCDIFSLDDYKEAMEKATQGFKGSKVVFSME